MHKFTVGDLVRWESSAGGYTKQKSGSIVCIVPSGGDPSKYMKQCAEKMGINTLPDVGRMARDHESYIVHVPGVTHRGKGKLYFPLVCKLRNCRESFF